MCSCCTCFCREEWERWGEDKESWLSVFDLFRESRVDVVLGAAAAVLDVVLGAAAAAVVVVVFLLRDRLH